MVDLPVCSGVSDYCPIYSDVVVATEVQELFGELGVVVSDDIIRNPEAENNILDKTYCFFGANCGYKLNLDPLGGGGVEATLHLPA
jgi:hypothetical protein